MQRSAWNALALLALTACGDAKGAEATQAAAPPPATPVVVAEIGTADVPVMREYVARTEAKESVTIQARVEAILEAIEFDEGKAVKAGQVLYRLRTATYEANLASAQAALARGNADLKLAQEQVSVRAAEAGLVQAKAKLKKAEQDVARLRPLAEQDAVPRQDLDTALAQEEVAQAEVLAKDADLENSKIREEVGILQAQAEVQAANAALDLAELDLGYCTIRCPLDGLVGRTLVHAGNLVGRGEFTELVTISSMDPMYATLAISEAEYLAFFRRREAAGPRNTKVSLELILADDSVYEHTGALVTAESTVAIETGTLQIVVEFPNPPTGSQKEHKLRPGQFGRVRFAAQTLKDAVLVPQRAIMEQQGARIVYVVEDGDKVALRSVQVTERHEEFFVVVDGLAAGERVVIEGQLKVRPGMTVKPTDKPASAEPEQGATEPGDEQG